MAKRALGWFPSNSRLAYGAKVLEGAFISRSAR
jgi:hypothetical protein